MNELVDLQSPFDIKSCNHHPVIIAGPCSAESYEQVMQTAEGVVNAGANIFRAGAWKPRTMPGAFEGRGEEALPWIAEVHQSFGIPVCTEIANASHLEAALDFGINLFWIGARTSANPFAVQDIADYIAKLPESVRKDISIMVKNPVNPDVDLWIGALMRIYASGVHKLAGVHRGFSSYGPSIYRNRPEWRIPIEMHRRYPKLPMICDPSHIGGKKDLILPISRQAIDLNFDGLIIETHCNPDVALSDAAQQITPSQLADITKQLYVCRADADTAPIDALRNEIDAIDDEITTLLARRMKVSEEIGKYKKQNRMAVIQPKRYNDLMQRRAEEAAKIGLSPDFMRDIFATIHQESVKRQL